MKKIYADKLAEELKRHQPKETILVTGSRTEGRRILTLLAAQGHVLVGVRTETPFSLARELCAEWFSMDGMPRLIEEVEGADMVCSCLSKSTGIYSDVNAKTLTATRTIYRTFQEMAMADIVEELDTRADLTELPKLQELLEIHAAYTDLKRAKGVLDRGDLMNTALKAADPKNGSPLLKAHYVVLGDYAPAPLERKLLQLLAGEDRLAVVKLPCAEGTEIPLGAMAADLPREDAVKAVRVKTSRFAACRGMETEVRFPFRDILKKNRKLEECAVVYLSGSYAQPLYEEAARFSIPVSMGGGLSLKGSLLYTTLLKVKELAEKDLYAEMVCGLLEGGHFKVKKPIRLAERIRKMKVGWGEASRYDCVTAYDPKDCPSGMQPEEWTEQLKEWDKFLKALLCAATVRGEVETQRKALLDLLPYCYNKNQSEGSAVSKAGQLVAQVTRLEKDETLLSRLLALMETAVHLNGGVESGMLYCAPVSQAVCTGRKYLYVVGLSRDAVQGVHRESPILLDEEREMLGELKTSILLGREQEFRFLTLLVRHDGEFIFSYPDFESDGMLEQKPAPFFQEASKGLTLEKVTYIPKTAELMADHLISADEVYRVHTAVSAAAAGTPAVLQPKLSKKDQLQQMSYSATALEDALKCPYLFYLKRVMNIRSPQPVERDPEKWLDAGETGTFCHKVLEDFYKLPQPADWKGVFEAEFRKLKEKMPPVKTDVEEKTEERLRSIVERAVDWTARAERTVLDTEKKFQQAMTFGQWTINVEGSIDRVDQLPGGEVAILDYKTGNSERMKSEMHRHWQHYLYTLAEETLPNGHADVKKAGYLFLDVQPELVEKDETPALRDEIKLRIEWLLDRISDETKEPECLPCFREPRVTKKTPPGPKVLEAGTKTERNKALTNCGSYCEFAMICPAQQKGDET